MTSVCAALLALNVQPAFSAETPGVSATQQRHAIQGIVTDGNEPIIGASVMVKGKNQGAVTDMDGHFSIDVPPGTELVISYLGYQPKTVKAAAGMKVTLSEDSKTSRRLSSPRLASSATARHWAMVSVRSKAKNSRKQRRPMSSTRSPVRSPASWCRTRLVVPVVPHACCSVATPR